jgi:hypothetical protein
MDEIAATVFRAVILGAFLSLPTLLFSRAISGIVSWFNDRDDPRIARRRPEAS